jgi:repressor LexA
MTLTPRQQQVLDTIVSYIDQHGYPPTVRELMAALGIQSPNGIMCHIKALERKHRVTREPGKSRTLRVVGEGKQG